MTLCSKRAGVSSGLAGGPAAGRRIVCAAWLVLMGTAGALPADELPQLDRGEFEQLHQLLKPQAGESRWMEIDWHPHVWEARQKAAAEGKPLFLWAGSGGAPAAGC